MFSINLNLPLLRSVAALSLIPLLASCTATSGSGIPDVIVAERGGFVPEGIEYDNNSGRFLTGSLADGTIYAISNSGRLTPVIEDEGMASSVGIEVDEARNRVLAAITERGSERGAAMLGVYDLGSGARLALVDLVPTIADLPADASHFANDVAISAAGTAYVTDTRMNIIYRVDSYYKADVLLDLGRDSDFNINGIEYHPAGYLLVASPRNGELIRVPVNNPGNWSLVELEFPASGADGLVWTPDGGLVATSNNSSRVFKYMSEDNWRSARLAGVASFTGLTTTAAVVGSEVFVVQPHFSDPEPPTIQRARF